MIEKNDLILQKFCSFKDHLYDLTAQKSNSTCSLGELITRKGQLLKNKEWISNKVLDLSTMKSNNIFIETFSPGANFSTNIKSIEDYDLVYGSIRPYFKKCGFALDVDFVAGSVYSFDVIDDSFYLWVLSAISNESFHLYTSKNSQGTKMPIINWDVFCKYMLPIPGSSDLEKFNKAIDPLFKNCCNIMRKNKELIKIKARLLDKYF